MISLYCDEMEILTARDVKHERSLIDTFKSSQVIACHIADLNKTNKNLTNM